MNFLAAFKCPKRPTIVYSVSSSKHSITLKRSVSSFAAASPTATTTVKAECVEDARRRKGRISIRNDKVLNECRANNDQVRSALGTF